MRFVVILITGMALVACSDNAATPPISSPSAATDTPPPADLIPDVTGESIEALIEYGAEHADEYGGLYIDPPGSNRVVMLFTGHIEQHASAVEAIKPGTTVRQVDHTEAELTALLDSIDFEALQAQGIEPMTAGLDTIANRVFLEAKSNDPTLELRLEAANGGLLDVTIHPVPGPWSNVAEGDGWRLLAAGRSETDAYVVRAATDEAEYAELWAGVGVGGPAPDVDLASEVVVSFGHGIGSTCSEVRLDDVRIGDGVVLSVTSDPLAPRACTADLVGAALFVVALERTAVNGGFTLWLNEFAAESGNDGFSQSVDVELP